MTNISSNDYRAERARVAKLLAAGQVDYHEGSEQLANLDVLISCAEKAEAAEAKRVAHRKRQEELAAQSQRVSDAAYRSIGREPPTPEHDYGRLMFLGAMAGQRTGRPVGIPVPGMAEYFADRREFALRTIAKVDQQLRGGQ